MESKLVSSLEAVELSTVKLLLHSYFGQAVHMTRSILSVWFLFPPVLLLEPVSLQGT
jgi:hypothetical protein